MSEQCPYQAGRRNGYTCRCEPRCKHCTWGKHAAIHHVGKPYPNAHDYEPAIRLLSADETAKVDEAVRAGRITFEHGWNELT